MLWGLRTSLRATATSISLEISRTRLNFSFKLQPQSSAWNIYIKKQFSIWFLPYWNSVFHLPPEMPSQDR